MIDPPRMYDVRRGRYYVPRPRNYRSDDRMSAWSWLGLALIFLGFIGYPVTGLITSQMNNRVQVITVTSKDDQSTGKGHQYLIFTPQGVFKDTDNFWRGKFDSSDLFNKLQEGHRYRCDVHGTRNHGTSNYPDLMSCDEIAS